MLLLLLLCVVVVVVCCVLLLLLLLLCVCVCVCARARLAPCISYVVRLCENVFLRYCRAVNMHILAWKFKCAL